MKRSGSARANPIVDLSIDFAILIVEYGEVLKAKSHFEVARQIIRSGTSIGANISEAQDAESKQDFIHKMKIAAKESNECHFWLTICLRSTLYPDPKKLVSKSIEIQKVLSTIIGTAKRRLNS